MSCTATAREKETLSGKTLTSSGTLRLSVLLAVPQPVISSNNKIKVIILVIHLLTGQEVLQKSNIGTIFIGKCLRGMNG